MREVQSLSNAFLLVKDHRIEDFGPMAECPDAEGAEEVDCSGRLVLPTFIDSHTHLVFAQARSKEFRMRMEGKSYQEIAAAGGGILNSAEALAQMSEQELFDQATLHIQDMVRTGTTALEIKSGYGLSTEAEMKMLRVIRQLKFTMGIPIRSTFLGAHALPLEYKENKQGYMDHMFNDLLPEIAAQGLADYVDIFCEQGYFDLEDLRQVIEAGKKHGLKAKVHVNQFNSFGAVPLACELGALSVDHLEVMHEEDFDALAGSETLAVGLPLCSLFLNIPYAPGREIIDRGIPFSTCQ